MGGGVKGDLGSGIGGKEGSVKGLVRWGVSSRLEGVVENSLVALASRDDEARIVVLKIADMVR